MIGYVIGMNFVGVHIVLHALLVAYSLKNVKALTADEDIDTNDSVLKTRNTNAS